MAGMPVTGPQMWHKYLKFIHVDTELDSVFKVDSVSQHMHLPVEVGCHLAELEHVC